MKTKHFKLIIVAGIIAIFSTLFVTRNVDAKINDSESNDYLSATHLIGDPEKCYIFISPQEMSTEVTCK